MAKVKVVAKTKARASSVKRTVRKPRLNKPFWRRLSKSHIFVIIFGIIGSVFLWNALAATNIVSYSGKLTSSSPVQNYTISAGDTGTITATHNSKDSKMRVSILDANGNILAQQTGSRASTTTTVKAGTYSIRVDYATAIKGAKNYTVTISYPVVDVPAPPTDINAPSVIITSPTTDTVSGTIAFAANASDNTGVSKVAFSVDGTTLFSDSTSSYSYSWDTTTVSDGIHSLKVIAFDAAGNTSTASLQVTVQNTVTSPPTTSGNKLTWTPPSGYQNYAVKNASVQTSTQTINGGGGDMLIKLPSQPTGSITLTNCRNVVIIGGQINIPPNSGAGTDQRGIYVQGCTGTVHIEGVYINGDIPTAEGDGIAISAPSAIVQVQNVRVYKLYGGYDTTLHNHSDIIQPWGGVSELRVDRLTGSSNYQGLQINRDLGDIGAVVIKNTDIGDSGVPTPDGKGGYYVWPKCGAGTRYVFENTYVKPRSGKTLSSTIWAGGCGLTISGSTATFTHSDVTGSWISGVPAYGENVPAGLAGTSYVSPGYQ